jgi:hypothetical protein
MHNCSLKYFSAWQILNEIKRKFLILCIANDRFLSPINKLSPMKLHEIAKNTLKIEKKEKSYTVVCLLLISNTFGNKGK